VVAAEIAPLFKWATLRSKLRLLARPTSAFPVLVLQLTREMECLKNSRLQRLPRFHNQMKRHCFLTFLRCSDNFFLSASSSCLGKTWFKNQPHGRSGDQTIAKGSMDWLSAYYLQYLPRPMLQNFFKFTFLQTMPASMTCIHQDVILVFMKFCKTWRCTHYLNFWILSQSKPEVQDWVYSNIFEQCTFAVSVKKLNTIN